MSEFSRPNARKQDQKKIYKLRFLFAAKVITYKVVKHVSYRACKVLENTDVISFFEKIIKGQEYLSG